MQGSGFAIWTQLDSEKLRDDREATALLEYLLLNPQMHSQVLVLRSNMKNLLENMPLTCSPVQQAGDLGKSPHRVSPGGSSLKLALHHP